MIDACVGCHVGDALLRLAAKRIAECVRVTDTVARLSGDEFTIVLSALAHNDRVGSVVSKLIEALTRPYRIGEALLQLSASVGITLFPLAAWDVTELVCNADQAMYLAKAGGHNRFSYFTPSRQVEVQARLDLNRDLRVALSGGQFEVYFQPFVQLTSGRPVKAEALSRWRHPQRGVVGAADFFGATADVRLRAISDWVFAEATHWSRRWRDEVGHAIQGCINLGPPQFALAGRAARSDRNDRDRMRRLAAPSLGRTCYAHPDPRSSRPRCAIGRRQACQPFPRTGFVLYVACAPMDRDATARVRKVLPVMASDPTREAMIAFPPCAPHP